MDYNRPKIAFLIPRLGITDRGAEVFVYELAIRLTDLFSVTVLVRQASVTTSSPLIQSLSNQGISIKLVWSPAAFGWWEKVLHQRPALKRIIYKFHLNADELEMLLFSLICIPRLLFNKFDILFPVNGVWGAMVCRFIRGLRSTPYVYSSQGGIEPLIARQKPDLYFVLNKNTLQWYGRFFPGLRTVYTPMGVDVKRFSPQGKRVALPLPRPIIMVAAALIPVKNVELTIRTVAQLEKGSLLIVGSGPLKMPLQHLAQKLLPGRHMFISAAQMEMPSFYRAADVFTFAAIGEAFGLVYIEALASGLPVVANQETHVKRLVGQAGVLCDVTDIMAYYWALDTALGKKWGGLPRKQALRYSWEKVANKYKTALLEVLRAY